MFRRISSLILLAVALAPPAQAQTPADLQAIRSELEALRQSQEAIRKDMEAIRALLEQAMGPRPTEVGLTGGAVPQGAGVMPLTIAGRPAKGSAKALVTLVEYSDYHCPFCGQYTTQVYPQVDRDYVKTGKVRYVFKNYPIDQLHPAAFRAHEAAACAGDQGKYWEMHDKLFGDQRGQDLERYVEHALALGLDAAALRNCIEGPAHDAMIREDVAEAVKGGVRGTPVFVLAFTDPKGQQVTPARVLVGAQPYQAFKEALDVLLAQAAGQGPKP